VTVDMLNLYMCVNRTCETAATGLTALEFADGQDFILGNFGNGGPCNLFAAQVRNIILCHDCQSVRNSCGALYGTCSNTTSTICVANGVCSTGSQCPVYGSTCVQNVNSATCKCQVPFYGTVSLGSSPSFDNNCTQLNIPPSAYYGSCNLLQPSAATPVIYDVIPQYTGGGAALHDGDTSTGFATPSNSEGEGDSGYIYWSCLQKPTTFTVKCMDTTVDGWGCSYLDGASVSYYDTQLNQFVFAFLLTGITTIGANYTFNVASFPPSPAWKLSSTNYLAVGEAYFSAGAGCARFTNSSATCSDSDGGAVCKCSTGNCVYYCNNGAWSQYNNFVYPANVTVTFGGQTGGGGIGSSSAATGGGGSSGGGGGRNASSSSTGGGGGISGGLSGGSSNSSGSSGSGFTGSNGSSGNQSGGDQNVASQVSIWGAAVVLAVSAFALLL